MKLNFISFRDAINQQITTMLSDSKPFTVNLCKDTLWDLYLGGFSKEDNPIYRTNTEHDCNCCKSFIRKMGNLVTVGPDGINTIWDINPQGVDEAYVKIARVLAAKVKSSDLKSIFLSDTVYIGDKENYNLNSDDVAVKHNHFYYTLPDHLVLSSDTISSRKNQFEGDVQVLNRGLTEITDEAIDIVLDLVSQNTLYRGEDYKSQLIEFKKLTQQYKNTEDTQSFVFCTAYEIGLAGRIKNTLVGTLLTDLSKGEELEVAVSRYEQRAAPTNYKRPNALITQGMIEKAKKTVERLGVEQSLYRSHAAVEDITINNVLFADRDAKSAMGLFDNLQSHTKPANQQKLDKVDEVSIDKFISDILPTATGLEVMVKNNQKNNFVTLIGPSDIDSPPILKWGNNFSWTYNGDVTDSIKERVKSAGGNVNADVRVSLAWENKDDLDLHVVEPDKQHIYYNNPKSYSTGGFLDVDQNAGSGKRGSVENIAWQDNCKMKKGVYGVYVNNYCKREAHLEGFKIEFEFNGNIKSYEYTRSVKHKENVNVLSFNLNPSGEITLEKEHLSSQNSKDEVWNIHTNNWEKVSVVMLSPNYWDDNEIGNKHYFFMIDGCKNPESVRGFYNEFLSNDFHEQRKVFEHLGSQMKAEYSDSQLSGVGFSSTQRNELLCKVSGSFNRIIKIKF